MEWNLQTDFPVYFHPISRPSDHHDCYGRPDPIPHARMHANTITFKRYKSRICESPRARILKILFPSIPLRTHNPNRCLWRQYRETQTRWEWVGRRYGSSKLQIRIQPKLHSKHVHRIILRVPSHYTTAHIVVRLKKYWHLKQLYFQSFYVMHLYHITL